MSVALGAVHAADARLAFWLKDGRIDTEEAAPACRVRSALADAHSTRPESILHHRGGSEMHTHQHEFSPNILAPGPPPALTR